MVEFREINRINCGEFDGAMEIYVQAFPSNERQPVRVISERVSHGLSKLYVGNLGDEIIFLALLWPLRSTDFILLDYLATKDKYRGRGIASAFFKKMNDELRNRDKYFILEVESPRSGNNKREREERVSFYRHLGARELKDIRYMLPPLDGSTPTEMLLMMFPEYKDRKINGDVIKKTIIQIYRELYSRDEDDPLLSTFVHTIGDTVDLV